MNATATALVAATRRCIARDGLAATTSRSITAEAGANLGAITYHFGSKDRLVAESLLQGFREMLAPAMALLDSDGDAALRTLEIVQTLLVTLDERRDDAVAYVQALAHAPMAVDLQQGIIGLWSELRGMIAADMTHLQRQGIVGEWVEPTAMSGVLLAVANGMLVQAVVDPEGPAVADVAAQFATLLLRSRDRS